MTLNLTELRDEPLGTPTVRDGGRRPFSMMVCYIPPMCVWAMTDTEMALGDAADGEGVFKIDVDGLSDEVLDHDATSHNGFASTFGRCRTTTTDGWSSE